MRSLLAAAVLATSTFVTPPAHAAPTRLVVSGTRSGYVDVTFPKPFEVDTYGWVDSRSGVFGGFWVERIGQPAGEVPDQFGVIRFTRDDAVATARVSKPAPQGGGAVVYGAGRYRIHAVADGKFSMSLPVTGLARTLRVSPRVATAKPRYSVKRATAVPGDMARDARHPITVGARGVAISLSFVRWRDTGTHQALLCVTKTGGTCEENKGRLVLAPITVGLNVDRLNTESYFATPGTLPAGRYDAYQRILTEPGVSFYDVFGMALVFDTPAGR
ncbi:MAG TPA: hypothetical protein VNA14_04020 [Mycobacteriales bacterium]|nr:hypothetical protein [Mycobacteriales bacterium]